MCRHCGRAVWHMDAPQFHTAPQTVLRRMCSDIDPGPCSRRCRHVCTVHGCHSNLNLCNRRRLRRETKCVTPSSIISMSQLRNHCQVCVSVSVAVAVSYLDRTICHPNSYRIRISKRCHCRNHACIPDRPCTHCTTDLANRVGICVKKQMMMGKTR